jgi:hypothetical protein
MRTGPSLFFFVLPQVSGDLDLAALFLLVDLASRRRVAEASDEVVNYLLGNP